MKTVKIFFLASVLLFAGLTKSNAGGNERLDKAYSQLNEQLKSLIEQISIEKMEGSDKSQFLVLTFSVNKKHEIENILVESTDDRLANHVKQVLGKEKIKVSRLFEGKSGQVSMQLPNEG